MKQNRYGRDAGEQSEQRGNLPAGEIDHLRFGAIVARWCRVRPAQRSVGPQWASVAGVEGMRVKCADLKGAAIKGMRMVDHRG